jgi:hypothetical protein
MKNNNVEVNTFSIKEVISEGFDLTKIHWKKLAKMLLVFLVLQMVWGMVDSMMGDSAGPATTIIMLVLMVAFIVISYVLTVNATMALIQFGKGKTDWSVEELFVVEKRKVGRYFLYDLLSDLVISLPFVMLALVIIMSLLGMILGGSIMQDVPAIESMLGVGVTVLAILLVIFIPVLTYVSLGLSQGRMLIVDQGMGVIDSVKKSFQLTKGVKLKLIGLGIVLALLNIGGALLFLVGLLITVPVSLFAGVLVYLRLSSQKELKVLAVTNKEN